VKTNVTNVLIEIDANLCPDNTKLGPNCDSVYTPLIAGVPKTGETLQPGDTNYYLFSAANQLIFDHLVISNVNRSLNKFFLLGKRGGFPLFVNKNFVDGTYDWQGSDVQANQTDIHLDYPRPDSYWFALASNDTDIITYTISLFVGGIADPAALNATTPQFDSKKENNTLSFVSTKGVRDFTYFTFPGAAFPFLKLGVAAEDNSDDTPDVFVDIGFIPSPDSNILANTNESEPAHLISATQTPANTSFVWYQFEQSTNSKIIGDWYVAVNSTNPFVLWSAVNGTCANNCSNHGICDDTSGWCNCNDGYEKYDCSEKVFPLVWIILIAIGGAILLAIAIGVPVSCYLKNKKKSGYERV